jgi:hypothetical protein
LTALVSLFIGHLSRRHAEHLWLLEQRLKVYLAFNAVVRAMQSVRFDPPHDPSSRGGNRFDRLSRELRDRLDQLRVLAPDRVEAQAGEVFAAAAKVLEHVPHRDLPVGTRGGSMDRLEKALSELIWEEGLDVRGLRAYWWQRFWARRHGELGHPSPERRRYASGRARFTATPSKQP